MSWLHFMFGFITGAGGLLLLVIFAGGYIGYKMSLTRRETKIKLQTPDPREAWREKIKGQGRDYLFSLAPEKIELKARDGLTLRGYFVPAARPTNKMVVFSHGYRSNGPDEWGVFIQFYHETLGWNILLPDQRAHGRSDGKHIGFAGREWQDLFDWTEAFKDRCEGEAIVALHGMSMGAATVLNCNVHTPPGCVKTIVEDCGYTNGYEMVTLSAKRDLKLNIPPVFWGLAFWYRVFSGVSLKKDSDPFGSIGAFKLPTLFVHGAADFFVPTEMGRRLYEAASVEKDCLFVEDAGHAMAYYIDPEAYNTKLLEWYGKHMGIHSESVIRKA